MDQDTYTAEVRRVETSFAETGQVAQGTGTGYAERVDVTYEMGAVIDGAWVKFGSVPGGTVDSLVAAEKNKPVPEAPGPTMDEVAPNPVPQPPSEPPAA